MADTSLLSAILAGQDPLAGQMLGGYQGAQLSNAALDPNFGHNEGPFGALAKTIAGIRGSGMTSDAVNAIMQARAAARPDTLSALNNPSGPLAYAAAHPEMNQQSLAQVLSTPPEAVQNYIEAARLGRANSPGAPPLVPQATNPVALPGYGKLNGPAQPAPAAPSAAFPSGYTGRPGAQPQAAAEPTADPVVAAAGMTPQQRQAMVQNPQQRMQILQRLRVLAAERAKSAASQGAGNAAQPPI